MQACPKLINCLSEQLTNFQRNTPQAASPRGVSPRPSWNGAVDDAPGAAVVGGVGEGGETAEEWLELELSKVRSNGRPFGFPANMNASPVPVTLCLSLFAREGGAT